MIASLWAQTGKKAPPPSGGKEQPAFGGPGVIVLPPFVDGPLKANGRPVATGVSWLETQPDGTQIRRQQDYTDAEMIVRGATPESIREWRAKRALRDAQRSPTHNVRVLLANPAVRKDAALDRDDLARVPLALEALARLDADFAKALARRLEQGTPQQALEKTTEEFQMRQEDVLREAFGEKAKRLLQLRMQFRGLPTVLYEPEVAKALQMSADDRSALVKAFPAKVAALSAQSQRQAAAAAKSGPRPSTAAPTPTFRLIAARAAFEAMAPEHRLRWRELVGPDAEYPRPSDWSDF